MPRGGLETSLYEWEPRPTDIAKYWEMYHNLPEHIEPVNESIKKRMQEIETTIKATGFPIKGSVQKHAYAMAVLGFCPWANSSSCPCGRFHTERICKRKLLAV